MTTALPTTYAPRVVPPRDYGLGRVGECGHPLCRYDPGPDCWVCEFGRARRRLAQDILECGPPASEPSEAGPGSASAGRAK